jgi:cytoskeletal protein RodZ
MWPTIRERLHDWYILIIALCLIIVGSIFASYQNTNSSTLTTAESTSGKKVETPPNESVAQNSPQPAASQAEKPALPSTKAANTSTPSTSTQQPGSAVPASAQHSPASHETHTAQVQPSRISGQAANSSAVDAGDEPAGLQLVRSWQASHALEPG